MKNIELTKQEVDAILGQLVSLPMNRVENIVLFFRNKVQKFEQPTKDK